MLNAAVLKRSGEPHSVQEAVWLVVSSPAKKKVATSGSSRSSLRGFPVWGSLQHWGLYGSRHDAPLEFGRQPLLEG